MTANLTHKYMTANLTHKDMTANLTHKYMTANLTQIYDHSLNTQIHDHSLNTQIHDRSLYHVYVYRSNKDSERSKKEDADYKRICKMLSICIAHSANIGGIASLTGTNPNVIMKGQSDM